MSNRKKITEEILKVMTMADPTGWNTQIYSKLLNSMTLKEFDEWHNAIKNDEFVLRMIVPHDAADITLGPLKRAAKYLGIEQLQKLLINQDGFMFYKRNKDYVALLPNRRTKQQD